MVTASAQMGSGGRVSAAVTSWYVMKFQYCAVVLGVFVVSGLNADVVIPNSLERCYSQVSNSSSLYPMTMTSFIDIIRRIESHPDFTMNLRTFSNALLHRFWKDGIENEPDITLVQPGVLPFKTSGFQAHKQHLLLQYLMPGSAHMFPNESITLQEMCTLHFMISGSVDKWERGDEFKTCPGRNQDQQKQTDSHTITGAKLSACPIERGVVQTRSHGTVSLSRILSGIASGLAPMHVQSGELLDSLKHRNKNKTQGSLLSQSVKLDNVWASTLAGDLAEAAILQGPTSPTIHLGPGGHWNDTSIPVEYYLDADPDIIRKEYWQASDAELLGSIDGLMMGQESSEWSGSELRLSQLLEMFYSDQSGNVKNQRRACSRNQYFSELIGDKVDTLVQQTTLFASLLALETPHYFTEDSVMDSYVFRAYSAFKTHMPSLLSGTKVCSSTAGLQPKMILNVAYDSTWKNWNTLRFLSDIADDVDVSQPGSQINVINGETGQLIVNSSHTITNMYMQWLASKNSKEVRNLELSQTLLRIKTMLENNASVFWTDKSPQSRVSLIVASSSRIDDKDYDTSVSLLSSIKTYSPEMQFIYVTSSSDPTPFVKLTGVPGSESDYIVSVDDPTESKVLKKLQDILSYLPRAILPQGCDNGTNNYMVEFVEFVNPNKPQLYRIHPRHLCSSKNPVTIEIQNVAHGYVKVCVSRDVAPNWEIRGSPNETCKEISPYDTEKMNFTNVCPSGPKFLKNQSWDPNCRPIFIKAQGTRSDHKCFERGCRLPDDVRFTLRIHGLHCLKGKLGIYPATCSASGLLLNPLTVSLTIFTVLYYLMNK